MREVGKRWIVSCSTSFHFVNRLNLAISAINLHMCSPGCLECCCSARPLRSKWARDEREQAQEFRQSHRFPQWRTTGILWLWIISLDFAQTKQNNNFQAEYKSFFRTNLTTPPLGVRSSTQRETQQVQEIIRFERMSRSSYTIFCASLSFLFFFFSSVFSVFYHITWISISPSLSHSLPFSFFFSCHFIYTSFWFLVKEKRGEEEEEEEGNERKQNEKIAHSWT